MRIACVGPFGDTNFGDYAMLVNDIYSLGDNEYIIFSYNKELMEALAVSYLADYHVKWCIVETSYHYEAPISSQYTVEYDTSQESTDFLTASLFNLEEIKMEIAQADIVLVTGGGYLNHVWNAKHRKAKLISILGTLLIANELKKRIVFLGNTYGPFDESSEFYSKFFQRLVNVEFAARDNVYSIKNLQCLGVNKEVALLPDDLYFLESEFFRWEALYERKILPEDYLVFEVYSSMDEIACQIDNIRQFVKKMKESYNISTVLFPLDRKYGGEYQANLIKKEVPECIYLEFGDALFRRVEDVNAVLKHAKIVLCQRYHMFLFAIANNTPVVQVLKDVCGDKRYYYSKTGGLLKQVFQSQDIREDIFMVTNVEEAFSLLKENLECICREQRRYFNVQKKQDEQEMKARRTIFLQEKILVSFEEDRL